MQSQNGPWGPGAVAPSAQTLGQTARATEPAKPVVMPALHQELCDIAKRIEVLDETAWALVGRLFGEGSGSKEAGPTPQPAGQLGQIAAMVGTINVRLETLRTALCRLDTLG